jgi:hypothetical protein
LTTGNLTLGKAAQTSGITAIYGGTAAANTIFNNVIDGSVAMGNALTTGTLTIGGSAQTGAITIGNTASSTLSALNLGTGNGIKTAINIGTGSGANGINIGGAASTTTVTGTLLVNSTSTSTDGATSVQPIKMVSTMNGTGGVGGRALFEMDDATHVLGGWANALKGYTNFGTTGSVTGLASAINAEMQLPAKTLTGGNYAPLEMELDLQASGTTGGTPVSFMYANASGDSTSVTDFDTTGYVMNLNGLGAAGTSKIFETTSATAATYKLRILVNGTPYYILMTSAAN